MNPSVLVFPYLYLLYRLGKEKSPHLLTLWVTIFLAFPTTRNKLGPISLYWSDLTGIAVLATFYNHGPMTKTVATTTRWAALLIGTYSIGVVAALLRYKIIIEPGFWTYRYIIALVPWIVIPRVLREEAYFRAIERGALIAAGVVGFVSMMQAGSKDTALWIDDIFYSAYPAEVGKESYQRRMVKTASTLRTYGMYGTSTAFAGASAAVGFLVLLFSTMRKRAVMAPIFAILCFMGCMTTYSRHGLLAIAFFVAPTIIFVPTRAIRVVGLAAGLAVVASFFVSTEFMAERFGRGGEGGDDNMTYRLVIRPLELLDRIEMDPTVALVGTGHGIEHALKGEARKKARYGFVSNSFVLYLFYAGILCFLVFGFVFVAAIVRSWNLPPRIRDPAMGTILGMIVILASDNYAYLHTSFVFMWSLAMAFIWTIPGQERWNDLIERTRTEGAADLAVSSSA